MKQVFYQKHTIAFLSAMLMSLSGAFAATSDATSTSLFPALTKSNSNELKPHVGIQIGYADSGSHYDGTTNYGIEIGYQPYVPFAAAIEVTGFSNSGENNSKLDRTNVMAKGTYNFGGSTPIIRDSYIGAAIGPVFDTAGANETNLGLKALIGFDYPLTHNGLTRSKSFSLGASANYLAVMNAQDTFLLNGILKYWF